VLSNRADLVSGGEALVEIVTPFGPNAARVKAWLNGQDVTREFAARSDGRIYGLLTGLRIGRNVLRAQLGGGEGAKLRIDNFPIGGPIFSGFQIQPWQCTTATNGLGPPTDSNCDAPTKFSYVYMPTNSSPGFQPYDPANPPTDVATTTTDQGTRVPYIVRVEEGVEDRGIYALAVLDDFLKGEPEKKMTPLQRAVLQRGQSVDPATREEEPDLERVVRPHPLPGVGPVPARRGR